jgi:hypothetical protein
MVAKMSASRRERGDLPLGVFLSPKEASWNFARKMAGDLSATRLDGSEIKPAAFLGDVEGEGINQRSARSTAGDGGWAPETGAG